MGLFKPEPHETDLARMIFPELRPGQTSDDDLKRLAELGVGGFCVYEGPKAEVARSVELLRGVCEEPPLFSGDYEWGVGRHVPDGTLFPPMMAVGAAGSDDLAYRKGLATAREARAMGVDWVLAPVVDLATRRENPIVNTRAFGAYPGETVRLARAFLRGLTEGGALGCLKHFPGHGETWLDSHLDLPRVEMSEDALWARELVPYRELAGECGAVMLGHLLIPSIDPEHPVSLSRRAVEGLLRGRLGFKGLVATDALMMGAIAKHYPVKEAAALAVNAGVDVLLVPGDPFALHAALVEAWEEGKLSPERPAQAAARLRAAKVRVSAPGDLSIVGSEANRREADALARAALAWVKSPPEPWLAAGEEVAYLELGSKGESLDGRSFVERLAASGARWKPYVEGWTGRIVVGVFSSPTAFSGAINLAPEDEKRLRALPARAPLAVVSFGSPFVFPEPDRLSAGLCAFSSLGAAQAAAADALLGRFEPRGKVPVETTRALRI